MKNQTAVIVGAGAVGATIAFTLLAKERFREIILLDIDREKAEGEVLDLSHGIPFVRPCKIRMGSFSDCKDADVLILAAGAAQKPGESRTDLLSKNAGIFREILENIMQSCRRDALFLVVTNPVDVLTYVTLQITSLPPSQVLGTGTVLDTARLRSELAAHTQVDPRDIHAYVLGEHGDTEVFAWQSANICGLSISDFCQCCGKCSGKSILEIGNSVRDAAYEIVSKKGATYYAISLATERILRALEGEHALLTVSALLTGEYGISDVCLSIPRIVGSGGVERSIALPLSDKELSLLRESAAHLKALAMEIGY